MSEKVARLEVRVDNLEARVDKHDERIEKLLLVTERHFVFFRGYHWFAGTVVVAALGVAVAKMAGA